METKKDPDCLVMSEGDKSFSISMTDDPVEILIQDTNGGYLRTYDDNQVEFFFSQNDERGWGFGCEEHVSTRDLKEMADCIRDVIWGRSVCRKYSCRNDVFKIEISYDADTDSYTFTGALVEMLMREYHISITKTNLTRAGLDEYIEPFFIWEKEHPVVKK